MNKPASINGARFRRVLGNYPTGVCVVTALETDGSPVGLTIGSFTSVSLDPTLVAFFADKRSSTWAQIQNIGRFCVNVLSDDQVEICRNFSQRGGEKFFGLPYRFSPNGSPVLEGVVAWIDCDLQEVYEAGDHDMAIGAVVELDTPEEAEASEPLIFFQGKFCRLQAID
ncbi:flavin reductase family protein [Altererythrobacter sp. BO-6]|uniref:flavin reductase family protein n=1 Tax=Altererythrobacter sp. BO-6 TaxID=2604537 RepID=UPI0013E17DD8|nr:flavin reductase family protein [Altererythrobacter sp. BO-6]QIG55364.1 flavin reductase family protein [Altererythrobacter sp. BO-6]